MADPILDKAQVRARIQEVGGNRVLADVEMALGGRDSGQLAVVFHEGIELPAGNRRPSLREKQGWREALPLTQVDLECFDLICSEGIDPWQGSFYAMNGHPLLLEVQIIHVQEAHFRRPQAVPIGDEKERPVTLPRDDPEKGAQLWLGQKVDGGRIPRVRHGARRYACGKIRASAAFGDSWGNR